jgi:hypothetical protein
MKRATKALSIAVLLCAVALAGCTPVERTAYNTIIAAKAFLDAERKAHPECVAGAAATVCVDLARAVAGKDVLIDSLEVYCSGPQFATGGACQAPKKGTPGYAQAVAKIQAAIANYDQIEKDLKGLHQ